MLYISILVLTHIHTLLKYQFVLSISPWTQRIHYSHDVDQKGRKPCIN